MQVDRGDGGFRASTYRHTTPRPRTGMALFESKTSGPKSFESKPREVMGGKVTDFSREKSFFLRARLSANWVYVVCMLGGEIHTASRTSRRAQDPFSAGAEAI